MDLALSAALHFLLMGSQWYVSTLSLILSLGEWQSQWRLQVW
jgi:hypothetical protein